MARINLTNCYNYTKEFLEKEGLECGVGKLTDELIKNGLLAYFLVNEEAQKDEMIESTRRVERIFIDSGIEETGIRDDLIKGISDIITDELIRKYPRDYSSPYQYRRGILTIPYLEQRPGRELMGRIAHRYAVVLDGYENTIRNQLKVFDRFTDESFHEIAKSYFAYTSKVFFNGFAEQETIHPLEAYFDHDELSSILIAHHNDNLDKDDVEVGYDDFKDQTLNDLILDVFAVMENNLLLMTNTVYETLGLNENSIVYLYGTGEYNRALVYVDREDLKTRVFNTAFDLTTCTIRDDAKTKNYNFCKCYL